MRLEKLNICKTPIVSSSMLSYVFHICETKNKMGVGVPKTASIVKCCEAVKQPKNNGNLLKAIFLQQLMSFELMMN